MLYRTFGLNDPRQMIADLVSTYGYLAVFVGTLLEGETVLIAAGYAAHNGLLAFPDVLLIVAVRFLYGLRIAGPVIMGTSPIPLRRFALYNLIGAVVWAVLVAGAGYVFGLAIGSVIDDARKIEEIVLVGIVAIGLGLWLSHTLRARRRPIPHRDDTPPCC